MCGCVVLSTSQRGGESLSLVSAQIAMSPQTAKWPRHDRASEFDSWDCVDELVAEEDYSQEWGEAASR